MAVHTPPVLDSIGNRQHPYAAALGIDSLWFFFGQQSRLLLFAIFVFGPTAQAQFTVVRSSIGHHLGSSFQTNNTQPYTAQYLVGQPIVSAPMTMGAFQIIQGLIQPIAADSSLSDLIHNTGMELEFVTYPNPVNQTLYVDIQQSNNQPIQLKIVDAFGRILFHQERLQATHTKIDVSALAAGVYLLQAKRGAKTVVKRFVKRTDL